MRVSCIVSPMVDTDLLAPRRIRGSEMKMSREITHRKDPDDGHMIQLVSPQRLREILDEDGETYERPDGFGSNDEWIVSDEEG